MGNVVNRELSIELYEISGWEDNSLDSTFYNGVTLNSGKVTDIPAYSLGYLLRKLPQQYQNINFYRKGELWGIINNYDTGGFKIYVDKGVRVVIIESQTPEDCLAKLCIELFKQELLTKGTI